MYLTSCLLSSLVAGIVLAFTPSPTTAAEFLAPFVILGAGLLVDIIRFIFKR